MTTISNQGPSSVINTVTTTTDSVKKPLYGNSELKNVYDLIVKGILPLDYQAPASTLVFSITEKLQSMNLDIDQKTERENIKVIKKAEKPIENYKAEVTSQLKVVRSEKEQASERLTHLENKVEELKKQYAEKMPFEVRMSNREMLCSEMKSLCKAREDLKQVKRQEKSINQIYSAIHQLSDAIHKAKVEHLERKVVLNDCNSKSQRNKINECAVKLQAINQKPLTERSEEEKLEFDDLLKKSKKAAKEAEQSEEKLTRAQKKLNALKASYIQEN